MLGTKYVPNSNKYEMHLSARGHGKPPQYYCLENSMDRGAWPATVHRIAKSWTRPKSLSMHTHTLVTKQ